MNDNEPLESQLRSWTPRRPSARIARRLFGAAAAPRRVVSWTWATPAVACALACVLAFTASNRHANVLDERDIPILSGTNLAFVPSKADVNVEWNVWPRGLASTGVVTAPEGLLRPITNR